MIITVLNGSPRKENTSAMVDAFVEGAQEAGHEVEVLQVGKMKIAGCMGCEYCHTKGEGQCIQKDDFEKVLPAYKDCDMVVFADGGRDPEGLLYRQTVKGNQGGDAAQLRITWCL